MLENFSSNTHKIKVSILDGGITEKSKNKLKDIGKKFNTEISYFMVSSGDFKDCPVTHHVTVATFYRLVIPNKFEKDVSKVIYIDCDTLVLGNIEELYMLDVQKFYFAAAKDFIEDVVLKLDCTYYQYLTKYFNGGVLLLNLDKLREENMSEKWFDFLKNHSHEVIFPDQDTMNYLCRNDWLVLDRGWNFQVDRNQEKVTPTPKILHFTTGYKPGHRLYHNYYQKDYMKYLKLAWPGYRLKPVSFWVGMKQIIKFIPFSVPVAEKIRKVLNL